MDIRSGFYLDKWFVCPKELVLFDGQNYQRLEPKVMEVLVYLHDNLNEVVSREQLIAHVWQGRYASDESITRIISVLRRAFNESHQDQRLIKTIPKQGYQLCWQQLSEEQPVDFTSLHQQVRLTEENEKESQDTGFANNGNFNQSLYGIEKYVWLLTFVLFLVSLFTLTDFLNNHNGQDPQVDKVDILIQPFNSLDDSHISRRAAALVENDLKYTLSNTHQNSLKVLSVVEGQKVTPSDFILTGSVVAQEEMLQIEVEFIDVKASSSVWQHRFYFQIDEYHHLLNIVRDTIGHYFRLLSPEQYADTRIEQMLPQILIERAKVLRRSFDVSKVEAALELLENASLLYPEHQQITPELAFTQLELNQLEMLHGFEPSQQVLVVSEYRQMLEFESHPLMRLSKLVHQYQSKSVPISELIKQALLLQANFVDDVEFYTLLGNWYKESGNHQAAISYFKQAIAIKRDYAKSHYCLAELQSLMGYNKQAINTLSLYLRNFPQQRMLQALSLKLYLSVGLFDEVIYGIKHFKLPVGAGFDGDRPSFFIQAYGFLNRPERVLEVTDELTASEQPISVNQVSCWLPPSINTPLATPEFCLKRAKRAELVSNDLNNLLLIARQSLMVEDYEQAVDYFEKVKQALENLKQQLPPSLIADLTYAYAKQGKKQEAEKLGETLLSDLVESPRLGLNGIGINDVVVLTALNRFDEAYIKLQQAVADGWLHWYSWQYRGPHPALDHLAQQQSLETLVSTINDKLEHLYNRSL